MLAFLLLFNVFAEHSLPWVAATGSALLAAPVLAIVARRLLSGGLAGGVTRREVVAWVLFGWMVLSTAWGLARVSSDEPTRRIVLLCIAFWIGHDALGRRPADARQFLDMVATLGAVLAGAALVWQKTHPAPDGRWTSSLESPALLGCFLCLSLPLTAAAWVARCEDGRPSRAAVQLLSASLAFQAAALIGSGSRLAQGAILVVALGWVLSAAGKRLHWSLRARAVASLGLAAVCLGVGWAAIRPAPGHESSFAHRLFIWETSARIAAASPLTGAGVGNYRAAFSAHRPWVGTDRSDTIAVVRDAHNDVLQMAAETGIPGGVMFLALLAMALAPPSRARGSAGVEAGTRAALCAWALNGLANGSVDVSAVGMLAFAVLGMRLSEPREGDAGSPRPEARAQPRRRLWPALAAALVVVLWLGTQGSARLADLLVAHAESGKAAEPGPYLELALALHPNPDTAERLAASLDTPAERVAVLSQVAVLYPWDAELRSRLSRALSGDSPEEALRQAEAATRLDAYNPYYRRRYGVLLHDTGRDAEAREQLLIAKPLFERTLEVAQARTGEQSPECEALRLEIRAVGDDLALLP